VASGVVCRSVTAQDSGSSVPDDNKMQNPFMDGHMRHYSIAITVEDCIASTDENYSQLAGCSSARMKRGGDFLDEPRRQSVAAAIVICLVLGEVCSDELI
jgi:hypothetical protein